MLTAVSWLRKSGVLLLLAFWGLAISHCALEQLPGLEFLACCHHPETAPHQDNDCDQDGCSVVESGFYKMEEQAASVPVPLLVLSLVLPLWEAIPPTLAPNSKLLSSAPPELPRVWQFSWRTALPPRAPSLAS